MGTFLTGYRARVLQHNFTFEPTRSYAHNHNHNEAPIRGQRQITGSRTHPPGSLLEHMLSERHPGSHGSPRWGYVTRGTSDGSVTKASLIALPEFLEVALVNRLIGLKSTRELWERPEISFEDPFSYSPIYLYHYWLVFEVAATLWSVRNHGTYVFSCWSITRLTSGYRTIEEFETD